MFTPDSSAMRGKSPLASSRRRLIVSKMGSSMKGFSCTSAFSVKAHPHGNRKYLPYVPKNKPLREVVAENAKQTRKRKKLSQPKVASLAKHSGFDIDQSTVSRVERATHGASVDHLEGLARGLGLQPWQLLVPAGADEKFIFVLRAWAQSGEQGRKLLYLAAIGALERDASEGGAWNPGTTHTR